MRVIGVYAVGAAILVAVPVAAGTPAAAEVRDGRIEFLRDGGHAYYVNADGSGLRMAPVPAYSFWSPSGRRIAFASKARIYIAKPDGTSRQTIARTARYDEPCFRPAWRLDSRKLVFQEGCDVDFTRMLVANSDGSHVRRIARAFWIIAPTWSPDGRTILFAGYRAPRRSTQFAGTSWGLFLTDAAGRKTRRIPGSTFDPVAYAAWAWSRDGKRIFLLTESSRTNRGLELSVIDRGGGPFTKLTGDDLNVNAFDVSPDGQQIAIQASMGTKDWEIYVIDADGSNLRQLTDNRVQDRSPAWSPDGQQIAFTSETGDNREIYVMNADGTGQTNVSHDHFDERPSWVP